MVIGRYGVMTVEDGRRPVRAVDRHLLVIGVADPAHAGWHPAFPFKFGTHRQDRLARPDDRGERDEALTDRQAAGAPLEGAF